MSKAINSASLFAPPTTELNANAIRFLDEEWRSESRLEASWLFAAILHDLRNPMGTICAGAEMLMTLDTTPSQVKRLAANMHRAAGCMRELLIDFASATYGNRSTPEI